jgi:endonuclease G, mitochondrial
LRNFFAILLLIPTPLFASYVEVGKDAFVYSKPQTSSNRLGKAVKGETYQLIQDAQQSGYYRVLFKTKQGYIYRTKVRAHLGEPAAITPAEIYTGKDIPRTFQYGEPVDSSGCSCQLLDRLAYKVYYDPQEKIAKWSAYAYRPTGYTAPRCKDCFSEDPESAAAPGAFPRTADYAGIYRKDLKGFDKGHQSPDASLKVYGTDQQKETYYLSNMTPQYSNTNEGLWRQWEDKVRELATSDSPVWVVTGPVFYEGQAKNPIKPGGPLIPHAYFMVVSRGWGTPEVVGILVKNEQIRLDWKGHYRETLTTVSAIQDLTGLDFLPDLPTDVQSQLESQVRNLWE